jgi:hypothetical protein
MLTHTTFYKRLNYIKRMKMIYIITIIAIIVSLIFVIFFHSESDKLSGEQNNILTSFLQYKNECKIFNAEDGEPRIYENELLNFSFVYPEDSLVCEREVKNSFDSHNDDTMLIMEIAVWSKASFMNNVPSSPELIVHINNPDLSLLPASEIISSEQIEISGIKTDKKLQKSSFCTTEDCPTFTSINLVHQGNNIEIQSWVDSQSILDSFKLN